MPVNAFVLLRTEGVAAVLDLTDGRLPSIPYWGADLGELSESEVAAIVRSNEFPTAANIIDDPVRLAVLPEHWTGWLGRPGLSGSRAGRDWSPKFSTTALRVGGDDRSEATGLIDLSGPAEIEVDAVDDIAGLAVTLTLGLTAGGLLRARAAVTNTGADGYELHGLTPAFPVPPAAREVLDMCGRWGKERIAQRSPLQVGHRTCGRTARAVPAPTRRPCCTSAPRASPSSRARSGPSTPAGAATTCTTPSSCRRVSR